MPPDEEVLDPADPIVPPLPVAPVAAAPAAPPPPPPPSPAPAPSTGDADRRALIADHQQRGASKALKKFFGTDDPVEIERIQAERQAKLDEHQQLVSAAEQKKREQMSEVERLNADVLRLTTENEQLKAQLQKVKGDKVAAEQDAQIRTLAVTHIQPKWLKYAMGEFRDYVIALPPIEQKKLDERRITKWFADFAKREPTCALEPPKPPAPTEPPAAPPLAAPALPPARKPLLAGARPPGLGPKPNSPPAPTDPFAGKTPKPGLPNSMNAQELKAYAKANNLSYPG